MEPHNIGDHENGPKTHQNHKGDPYEYVYPQTQKPGNVKKNTYTHIYIFWVGNFGQRSKKM